MNDRKVEEFNILMLWNKNSVAVNYRVVLLLLHDYGLQIVPGPRTTTPDSIWPYSVAIRFCMWSYCEVITSEILPPELVCPCCDVIRFLLAQMPEFCMALDTVQYSIRTIITELYRYHSFCSSGPNGMVFICSLCLWIHPMLSQT